MPPRAAPAHTVRTERRPSGTVPGAVEAPNPLAREAGDGLRLHRSEPSAAPDPPAGSWRKRKEEGGPVGRGGHSSVPPSCLAHLADRVGETVARGDLPLARELIEQAAPAEHASNEMKRPAACAHGRASQARCVQDGGFCDLPGQGDVSGGGNAWLLRKKRTSTVVPFQTPGIGIRQRTS